MDCLYSVWRFLCSTSHLVLYMNTVPPPAARAPRLLLPGWNVQKDGLFISVFGQTSSTEFQKLENQKWHHESLVELGTWQEFDQISSFTLV